jgi:hypothetical protein
MHEHYGKPYSNPFRLPNVVPDSNKYGEVKIELKIHSAALTHTIWLCATKFPLWKFKATHIYGDGAASEFTVFNNDEPLGVIKWDTASSGTAYVAVSNHRIQNARVRGKAFRTTNPKAAFDKVRKTFGRRNHTERLADAYDVAKQRLTDKQYELQRSFSDAENKHSVALFSFVQQPHVYEQFLAYAEHNEAAAKVVAGLQEARLAMQTINDVRAKYGKPESVLVVNDDGEYIVKYHDRVQIFDDGTMPYEIRARLGMLKLVDPGKAVDGFGFRVSEEVYVVLTGAMDGEGA